MSPPPGKTTRRSMASRDALRGPRHPVLRALFSHPFAKAISILLAVLAILLIDGQLKGPITPKGPIPVHPRDDRLPGDDRYVRIVTPQDWVVIGTSPRETNVVIEGLRSQRDSVPWPLRAVIPGVRLRSGEDAISRKINLEANDFDLGTLRDPRVSIEPAVEVTLSRIGQVPFRLALSAEATREGVTATFEPESIQVRGPLSILANMEEGERMLWLDLNTEDVEERATVEEVVPQHEVAKALSERFATTDLLFEAATPLTIRATFTGPRFAEETLTLERVNLLLAFDPAAYEVDFQNAPRTGKVTLSGPAKLVRQLEGSPQELEELRSALTLIADVHESMRREVEGGGGRLEADEDGWFQIGSESVFLSPGAEGALEAHPQWRRLRDVTDAQRNRFYLRVRPRKPR